MSARISDERLQQLHKSNKAVSGSVACQDTAAGLAEAIASRALVTELRALLIRVESFTMQLPSSEIHAATQDYARSIAAQLDSLLAAHDAQQADKTNG